jgi:homoserine/homoserine lactone efflux protein
MTIESLLLFTSIGFIAAITPGPAILLVSTHCIKYGLRYSIATILGNITGLFILSLLAVLGLSTVILYSEAVFTALKLVGACYLVFLGVKLWRNGFLIASNAVLSDQQLVQSDAKPKWYRLYTQGILIALSNPKAIGFTTALFPQFIDTNMPLAPQFLILVFIFMSLSFSCLLGYGLLAVRTMQRTRNSWMQRLVSKLFGTAFIGSGVALALINQD